MGTSDENVLTSVKPRLLPRILDLNRGQPCFIVGTVYMDMPLKPNVLEDMARSVSSFVTDCRSQADK